MAGALDRLLGRAKGAAKDALASLLDHCLPPPDGGGAPASDGFAHPGTLMGPREARLLRSRVSAGAAPWAAAAAALAADTPLAYAPCALRRVHIDFNGVGAGHDEFVERDGRMAYMQAAMFAAAGDERYARNAAAILAAWAAANESFTGQNAPLESAWGIASMARAAELLKWTWPAWPPALEAAFNRWVTRVILPNLRSEALARLPLGNWHTAVAEAKAQLAVLRGDRRLFDEALRGWAVVAEAYLKPSGECSETSRDLFHSQFGLGGLVQTAEIAWHQGVDLYSFRGGALRRCLELHALITNGARPEACCYPLKGVGFLPCGWEVALNHYSGRRGLAMPETERMLEASRPEKHVFCWGLGTLTHYGAAVALACEDAGAAGGGAAAAEMRRR